MREGGKVSCHRAAHALAVQIKGDGLDVDRVGLGDATSVLDPTRHLSDTAAPSPPSAHAHAASSLLCRFGGALTPRGNDTSRRLLLIQREDERLLVLISQHYHSRVGDGRDDELVRQANLLPALARSLLTSSHSPREVWCAGSTDAHATVVL